MARFEIAEFTPDLVRTLQAGILNTSISHMARELGVSRTTVRAIAQEQRSVSLAMEFRLGKWFQGERNNHNRELYNGIDALNRLSGAQRKQLVTIKDKAVWEAEKDRAARTYSRNWQKSRKKGGKFSVMSA